jgi:hypothetical protein
LADDGLNRKVDPLRATRAGSRLLPYVYGSGVESVLLAGQLT